MTSLLPLAACFGFSPSTLDPVARAQILTTKSRPLQSTSAGIPLCGLEESLGYRMSLANKQM